MCITGMSGQQQAGRNHDGGLAQGADPDAVLPNELATSVQGGEMAGPAGGSMLGCTGCAELGYCRRGLDAEQLTSGCTGAAP